MRDIDNFNIQTNSSDSILQLLAYLYNQNILQCLQPATHDRKKHSAQPVGDLATVVSKKS